MIAADKLRELLATRPAMPNTEELVRWWRASAELVREHFDDLKATASAVAELSAECGRRGRELDLVKAARDEACKIAARHIFAPTAGVPFPQATTHEMRSGIVVIDSGIPYRDKARIAELLEVGKEPACG